MSRFGGDPRHSAGNLAYRDPPSGPRWDADRFATERDRRVTETVIERDRTYEEYRPAPRRAPAPVYEEQRIYEDDRYGPRGSRQERRYYEDDIYAEDPRASRGAMIPFSPERPGRPQAPPRPGLTRRQSSLDTFDRKPMRRYDDYNRPPPPRIPVPVPQSPIPGRTRYERDTYEDVRIQEPEYYGDDGFREYREREWITSRRRNSSHSRDRETVIEKEEVIEEEKPFPRRGKTKMPKRMIHTKALFDLGYPYYEENETIIIERALGPENIDEVINMSKDYYAREDQVSTTRLIEAPPPEIRETIFEEKVVTVPIQNAPPSVQNWDGLRSPSPKSHRSRSRRRSRRGSSPETIAKEEIFIERKITRDASPARTAKSGKSRKSGKSGRSRRASSHGRSHRSSSSSSSSSQSGTEIIERRKIIEEDNFDESNSVHVGPLALVRSVDKDRRKSRNERDLKEEIRQLEAERRALRKERRHDDVEIVKIERVRERSPSRGRGELVVVNTRDRDEVVEVRKDRRARSAAPTPGLIRAMMATLT